MIVFKFFNSFMSKSSSVARTVVRCRNFSRNARNNSLDQHQASGGSGASFILKASLFSAAFTGGCYSVAVIANYEKIQYKRASSQYWSDIPMSKKYSELRNKVNEFWNNLTDVKKATICLIFLNTLVFIAWRIPSCQNLMNKYFVLSPVSGRYSQMLFSTFSHHQLFHIGFNMIALYSMSGLLSQVMPLEQFLAFYLSAGVFASLASSAFKILSASTSALSLGASGSVIGCFALSSFAFPHSSFYVFPIPFPVEAQTLIKFLVLFDAGCLVFGYRRMDHAAHLGGVLYAYLFATYGPYYVKKFQDSVLRKWKSVRN